jgi:hypothetical protein
MAATQLPLRILRDELALAIGLGCAVLPMPALAQCCHGVLLLENASESRNS